MRPTTAAVTVVAAAILLSGCSVPRAGNPAGSDIAGCAAVLPPARDAVRGKGVLVLIHALGRKDEESIYKDLGAPPLPAPPPPVPGATPPPPATNAAGAPIPKACVVVYQGDYAAGAVAGAPSGARGHYAIIVARVRHPKVDRVLLVDELPESLPRQ